MKMEMERTWRPGQSSPGTRDGEDRTWLVANRKLMHGVGSCTLRLARS